MFVDNIVSGTHPGSTVKARLFGHATGCRGRLKRFDSIVVCREKKSQARAREGTLEALMPREPSVYRERMPREPSLFRERMTRDPTVFRE